MSVKQKHKLRKVHHLELALKCAGLAVDYKIADLMHEIIQALDQKGGELNIMDVSKITYEHENKWREYSLKQDKND